MTTWSFKLFEDQNSTVSRAIEAAKQQAQTDQIGAALEFICAEWSLMSENQQTTLEEQIELMEARFGVKLQVVTARIPRFRPTLRTMCPTRRRSNPPSVTFLQNGGSSGPPFLFQGSATSCNDCHRALL